MKRHLRTAMRAALRSSPADSKAIVSEADSWLRAHPERRVIAVFHPTTGEPDLTKLTAAHAERTWVYPAVRGPDIEFRIVRNHAGDLEPGSFGILEPRPHLPAVEVADIDVFFCPGLAFDRRNHRLGRGKGFYDRMLAGARPDAVRIGVGFPCQIVEDVWPEAHDQQMDLVFCGLPSHPLGHDQAEFGNAGENPLASGGFPEESA